MKSGIMSVVALVVVVWSTVSVRAQPGSRGHVVVDPEASRNGWIFSLEEGLARARKNAKPLMVVLRCNP